MVELKKTKLLDPRTKIIFVFFFTASAIFFGNISVLNISLGLGMVFSLYSGVQILPLFKRMRRFIGFFLILMIIQSVFTNEGNVIFRVFGLRILTDIGVLRGIQYLYRMLIVILSGAIISTSGLKDNLQALVQLGLPYDIGFMSAIGIRFLPIFMEDIKNTQMALSLRGIDLEALKLKDRLQMVTTLFLPTVVGALQRAKELSLSAEARGYKIQSKRTYYRQLKFSGKDYGTILLTIASFVGLVIWKG